MADQKWAWSSSNRFLVFRLPAIPPVDSAIVDPLSLGWKKKLSCLANDEHEYPLCATSALFGSVPCQYRYVRAAVPLLRLKAA
jgi:hypothetical protein